MTSPGGNLGDVAVAYLETRNYRRAAEVLQSALAEDPDNAVLLARYSQAMLGLKDYWRAASAAHAALGAPDNEHAMRLYTAALRGQRRLSDALWMARKTVEHIRIPFGHITFTRVCCTIRDSTTTPSPRSTRLCA